MRLFGIASAISGDIDDWYTTEAEAEAALRTILQEAPELVGKVSVQAVELDEPSRS